MQDFCSACRVCHILVQVKTSFWSTKSLQYDSNEVFNSKNDFQVQIFDDQKKNFIVFVSNHLSRSILCKINITVFDSTNVHGSEF